MTVASAESVHTTKATTSHLKNILYKRHCCDSPWLFACLKTGINSKTFCVFGMVNWISLHTTVFLSSLFVPCVGDLARVFVRHLNKVTRRLDISSMFVNITIERWFSDCEPEQYK